MSETPPVAKGVAPPKQFGTPAGQEGVGRVMAIHSDGVILKKLTRNVSPAHKRVGARWLGRSGGTAGPDGRVVAALPACMQQTVADAVNLNRLAGLAGALHCSHAIVVRCRQGGAELGRAWPALPLDVCLLADRQLYKRQLAIRLVPV